MTRDDPAAFAPPPAFGPFRVLHQIGIGALGPVFRTYEPTRDRLVAVKLFRLDVTPEQAHALAEQLTRAVEAGLFHPSIVEPIAAGVEGASAYRAEEYVAAESLDVAIRHYAPASLDRALPFITQLAGAIDFARTAGVGHGGLHLRDIFVTPDEARASGFGIVEAIERVGVRAPVRRPYSAPERIAGESWGTPADVFSLAAIGYELVTGRRPSGTGEQIGELTGENIGANATAIRAVLARAMHDDPARRYRTALEFASALEDAARKGVAAGAAVAAVAPGAVSTSDSHNPPTIAAPPPFVAAPVSPIESAADDDIIAEREADAADHLLNEEVSAHEGPSLFDGADEESVADLGLDDVAVAADESTRWRYDESQEHAGPGAHVDGAAAYSDREYAAATGDIDAIPPVVEKSRPGMLPYALMLVVGLLGGFAIAWALLSREGATPPKQEATQTPASAPSSGPATQSQPPARAYSEQAVAPSAAATAPQSREAPPVPGDDPAAVALSSARRGASVQSGRLTVISTPSRAGVTVNGQWRGRTPLTLDKLALGSYAVRVVQPGFAVSNEDVTLSTREPMRTISVRLQRGPSRSAASAAAPPRASLPPRASARTPSTAPREPARTTFAGTIYVDSRPRGARILIDGRPAGTTPASIPDVPIGSHVVRLELPEHRAWTTSTRVAAGEQARVTGSLELIR